MVDYDNVGPTLCLKNVPPLQLAIILTYTV